MREQVTFLVPKKIFVVSQTTSKNSTLVRATRAARVFLFSRRVSGNSTNSCSQVRSSTAMRAPLGKGHSPPASFGKENPGQHEYLSSSNESVHCFLWLSLPLPSSLLQLSTDDSGRLLRLSRTKTHLSILGFHSHDETAMLVYKTMAKCRPRFA